MKQLTTESLWKNRHTSQSIGGEKPFRRSPIFRQQHTLLRSTLPSGPDVRMIEIGCFPGGFLEYFYRLHGHTVTGLEYVQESCERCDKMLTDRGVPSTIIHGDLFEDTWNPDGDRWDTVFSAGLVEHFDDSAPAIDRHLQLVAPGGHCVISIPNHSGLNGRILKTIDRPRWDIHNRMCAKTLRDAFERAPSTERFELLCCKYVEHFGLWNCGVYERFRSIGRPAFLVARSLGMMAESALRWVPNSRAFSPNILLIAKARY